MADEPHRVRVVIADDEANIREILLDIAAATDWLDVLGVAEDADQAIEEIGRHRPDVAIVDVRMPRGGGPRVAKEARIASPETKVLALSAYADRGPVTEMLRAGALGYLVKGAPVAEILEAIDAVFRGQRTLSNAATGSVLDGLVESLERVEADREAYKRHLGEVRHVLDTKAVKMVYQPIVSLADREVRGFEALARFPEPEASPAVWFDKAKAVGLEQELELAALAAALDGIDGVPQGAHLSVNLSPNTLASPGALEILGGLSHRALVVEVTEHAPVDDYDRLGGVLARLRGRGIRLAVDDTGAGYASLRHIVRLDPDIIKLDIALTRGIETDRIVRALARGLTSFAEEIGAPLVAEGIETEGEVLAWQGFGVKYGQGDHLGRPAPLRT